jgi:hypothetical protein
MAAAVLVNTAAKAAVAVEALVEALVQLLLTRSIVEKVTAVPTEAAAVELTTVSRVVTTQDAAVTAL